MHKSQKKISTLVAGAAALLAVAAYAQDQDDASAKTEVPMVSGGVGEQELADLKSVERQYDLKLLFAEVNGVYLAQVPVIIVDAKGQKIVDTVTKGPVLLLTLPAGSYKVTATQEGTTKEQKISVSPKHLHEYVIRFPTLDTETSDDHSQK